MPAAYLSKIGSGRHSAKLQDTREKKISVAPRSPGAFSEESGECRGPCCLGNRVDRFEKRNVTSRRGSAWPVSIASHGVAARRA